MADLVSLDAFIARSRRRPWQWGVADCAMWAADWVLEATGIDPATRYRGAYHDADRAQALLKQEGGYVPLIGWRMDQAGFQRTQSPQTGDIGIVNAPVGLCDRMPVVGTICAIRRGSMWVARSARGLHHQDFPLVTAWRI